MNTDGGKYEFACKLVMLEAQAEGAVLLVFNGKHGHGCSVCMPAHAMPFLPEALRKLADQIEDELIADIIKREAKKFVDEAEKFLDKPPPS